jgi:hypothetical protein
MRLLRPAALSALLFATILSLSGCASSWFVDAFGVSTPTSTPTPSATRTEAPPTAKPSPAPTVPPIEGWSECPRLVTDLNKNTPDPASYKQVKPTDFPVQEVGLEVLSKACVIAVTTNGETVNWAVLPGDEALAASIKARLINVGFSTGSVAGTLSNQATSEGALVSSFANGAALESFLVSAKGFARIQQPLVYVGSFFLS